MGAGSLRVRLAAVAALPIVMTGCAGDRYKGVDMRSGGASAEVQALARRAEYGDPQAQLELGERFEGGLGVPRDLRRAAALYQEAAKPPLPVYAYTPRVGRSPARTVLVKGARAQPGLAAAAERLARLRQRQKR